MSDAEFWISLWKVIALVVVATVISVASCTGYESKLVTSMVKEGVSPLDAACAVHPSYTSCLLRAAK